MMLFDLWIFKFVEVSHFSMNILFQMNIFLVPFLKKKKIIKFLLRHILLKINVELEKEKLIRRKRAHWEDLSHEVSFESL